MAALHVSLTAALQVDGLVKVDPVPVFVKRVSPVVEAAPVIHTVTEFWTAISIAEAAAIKLRLTAPVFVVGYVVVSWLCAAPAPVFTEYRYPDGSHARAAVLGVQI